MILVWNRTFSVISTIFEDFLYRKRKTYLCNVCFTQFTRCW